MIKAKGWFKFNLCRKSETKNRRNYLTSEKWGWAIMISLINFDHFHTYSTYFTMLHYRITFRRTGSQSRQDATKQELNFERSWLYLLQSLSRYFRPGMSVGWSLRISPKPFCACWLWGILWGFSLWRHLGTWLGTPMFSNRRICYSLMNHELTWPIKIMAQILLQASHHKWMLARHH